MQPQFLPDLLKTLLKRELRKLELKADQRIKRCATHREKSKPNNHQGG